MKARLFHCSLRGAFSLFEIVMVLGILAILALVSFPSFSLGDRGCIATLRSRLQRANDAFTEVYTHSILQSTPPQVSKILNQLTQRENPNCYFEYKKQSLIAHIDNKQLKFILHPQDFSSKPKIYCSFSNDLCRNFWGRKLKK